MHHFCVGARRADRLKALVGEIEAAGGRAIAVNLDVLEEASVIAAFDAAEAAFGPVDTVYANAGMNVEARAVDITMADWDQVLGVNTRGVFITAREGARRMM